MISNILKRNKSERDTQHFEGSSRFAMSGGKGGIIIGGNFIDISCLFFIFDTRPAQTKTIIFKDPSKSKFGKEISIIFSFL